MREAKIKYHKHFETYLADLPEQSIFPVSVRTCPPNVSALLYNF